LILSFSFSELTIEESHWLHRTEERIRAHVFLCVLALLLERVAEKTCGRSWLKIREELRTIKVGQLFGPHGTVFQTTVGSMEARKILKRLNVHFTIG
jgi:hypothetical protein